MLDLQSGGLEIKLQLKKQNLNPLQLFIESVSWEVMFNNKIDRKQVSIFNFCFQTLLQINLLRLMIATPLDE